MESLKRKSMEEPSASTTTETLRPQKQQRENGTILLDQPVTCLHEVSYPPGYVPSEAVAHLDAKPAKEFPFTLDPFQSEAIKCLDNGESVMVSAHTAAGKTVMALYAIAMSLRNKQRVIYTSPIKALSNQKFREFKEEFSDVGLMNGDVTIDPNASCLVMTTKIWRSMHYKGSEEVAWVIFDEVHYMRDRERGVVWEESIVKAPKNSRFVFLSATVPNAKEFADWVAKVHQQPCHIVYTDYRPTPLQHYIFPAGGHGLYFVVDEKGKFLEDSFHKALNALVPASESDKKRENGKQQKGLAGGKFGEESDIFKMVKMIIQRQYHPVLLFSFSKRDCEFLAMQMAKMDLTDDDEKVNIETIHWSALDMLSDDDKKLPQFSSAFHLSYNMLLNQIRCEEGNPENLLCNSFYQFQADCAIPDLDVSLCRQWPLIKQAKVLEEERNSMIIEEEDSVKSYYNLLQQYKGLKDIRDVVFSSKYCLPVLQRGRFICIECTRSEEKSPSFSTVDQVTWGVIIEFEKVKSVYEDDENRKPEDANYTVIVLTRCVVGKDGVGKKTFKIVPLKESGEPVVVSVPISQIISLSSARLPMPKDLLPLQTRENKNFLPQILVDCSWNLKQTWGHVTALVLSTLFLCHLLKNYYRRSLLFFKFEVAHIRKQPVG